MSKGICAFCGKEIGSWSPAQRDSDSGKIFHFGCYTKWYEKEQASRRLCVNCGYSRIIDHVQAMGDSAWTSQDLRCQKFNMDVGTDARGRYDKGKEAETCTSFINKEEYKQKALKGEITL